MSHRSTTPAVVCRPAQRRPTRGRAGGGADAGLEHRFEVLAIDRTAGKMLWQRTATTGTPHEGYHPTYGSFATNTMENQSFIASPVIVGGDIYLRSRTHLFAIGGDGSVD